MPTSTPLSWDQFLAEAARHTPETFGLSELTALVERLVLTPDLFEGRIQFCPDAYARNLLFKNDLFEAVCMCWQDDQRTSVHNHGRSFGMVVIVEGRMREEIFRRVEGDRLALAHTRDLQPDSGIAGAPVEMIHRLGNAGGPGSRLVSLHFYAGPLDEMDVFDLETGTAYRKPMRYLSDGDLPPTS
ncbi:MAG TPA: cysteine dioxygenase family protein [Pantanalinema sp.]